MAGSLTVIGGAGAGTPAALTGLVSIPSAFADSINAALQFQLTLASGLVTTGLLNLENIDAPGNTTFATTPSVPGGTLLEITNTDSLGAITAGSISGSYNVPVSVSALIVQAPGSETITANGTTSLAVFGSNSNVDYTVLTGSGSIYAAGGADSITLGADGDTPSYAIYSAGADTINMISGLATIDAVNASATTLFLGAAQATVTASDNSTVSVVFKGLTSGNLDFINNTANAATIYSGAYTAPGGGHEYATNAVTAYGGAGGGFFVGGLAGGNSLVGGSGVVTLQGGGNNDFLSVSGGTGNQLFSGSGAETLLAGSGTGDNTFQLNLKYTGLGTITGADMVSTEGSGVQAFLLGAGDSTLTGSSVVGASNVFDLIRNASVGSANYTVTDFASINGTFYISDGASSAFGGSSSILGVTSLGGDTTVTLTDHSTITFSGVASQNNLTIDTLSGGAISITYHS